MSTSDNERTPQSPLRAGLLAEGERLDLVAAAIRACPLLELCGQSGMPQAAGLPDLPWVDDTRVLIAQPDLQAVLLATSTRADAELGAMAAERGLHVWRLPPLARSFAEATEIATRIKRCTAIYRVASWWEYVADHAWHELDWPDSFEPVFSELRISVPGPTRQSCRASVNESGGGVLASDAYAMLEALVAVRGLPESVTAATGKYGNEASAVARETEDTAVAILRYADGGTALIRATWNPPYEQRTVHQGPAALVTLTDEEASVADAEGTITDRRPLPGEFLASELLRFLELVRGDARDRAAAAIERHVAVSALLETIYLAARTNHPESPRKFYEVQGWPLPRS